MLQMCDDSVVEVIREYVIVDVHLCTSHWPVSEYLSISCVRHTRPESHCKLSFVMADGESHAINASLLAGAAMLMHWQEGPYRSLICGPHVQAML